MMAAHPHYLQWLELYALCQDGVFFTLERCGKRGGAVAAPLLAAQLVSVQQDAVGSGRAGSVLSFGGSQGMSSSGKSKASKSNQRNNRGKKKKDRSTKTQTSPPSEPQRHQESGQEGQEAHRGWGGSVAVVSEVREDSGLHSSQARIRVVI